MKTNQNWEKRLADCASKRVGAQVKLIRWDRKSNGIDVPVFDVPETHKRTAIALGLTIQ